MTIAIYAGSFDPITNGHMDIIQSGLALADTLIIAIGIQPNKTPFFTFEERRSLIKDAAKVELGKDSARLTVVSFDNLLVDKAQEMGATLNIRGLREASDFDYEMQMAGMNYRLAPKVHTIFLPATPKHRPITSTLIRQIGMMGGDISTFVPKNVAKAIEKKFKS